MKPLLLELLKDLDPYRSDLTSDSWYWNVPNEGGTIQVERKPEYYLCTYFPSYEDVCPDPANESFYRVEEAVDFVRRYMKPKEHGRGDRCAAGTCVVCMVQNEQRLGLRDETGRPYPTLEQRAEWLEKTPVGEGDRQGLILETFQAVERQAFTRFRLMLKHALSEPNTREAVTRLMEYLDGKD